MREPTQLPKWSAVLLILTLLILPAAPALAQGAKQANTATTPVPRDKNLVKRHEAFVAMAKRGGIDLLFLGDSITDAWGGEGHNPKAAGTKIFEKEFVPLKAANFGIGGDRTQHVLWRLQNGELDGIQPKVVMLMIGTNNSNRNDNTAQEIAAGVTAIVKEIHQRSPKTKVLLLGIFPRATGKTPEANQAQMDKIKQVNTTIAKLDDGGKTVRYLDIGSKFQAPDGSLPRSIMPDQLHLSEKGYRIWADAVKGPIQELLGGSKTSAK
jgi:lysophospholipase L1-like esterase